MGQPQADGFGDALEARASTQTHTKTNLKAAGKKGRFAAGLAFAIAQNFIFPLRPMRQLFCQAVKCVGA